jgi:hypothetical protein
MLGNGQHPGTPPTSLPLTLSPRNLHQAHQRTVYPPSLLWPETPSVQYGAWGPRDNTSAPVTTPSWPGPAGEPKGLIRWQQARTTRMRAVLRAGGVAGAIRSIRPRPRCAVARRVHACSSRTRVGGACARRWSTRRAAPSGAPNQGSGARACRRGEPLRRHACLW